MDIGRTPMRAASLRRLEDAEMLYKTGRWLGAIYLHGYWVEMTIKVRLMEEYGVDTLEASRMLRNWVAQRLLVALPAASRQQARYAKPQKPPTEPDSLSNTVDNESGNSEKSL